jgi:hypothetical protein
LRRRAARMARPALVRMRSRKPCVLARRRLFGWNVRLLTGDSRSGAFIAMPGPARGRASARQNRPGKLGPFTVRAAVTTGQTKQPAIPADGTDRVTPGTTVYLPYTHPDP